MQKTKKWKWKRFVSEEQLITFGDLVRRKVVAKFGSNRSRAAGELGIGRVELWRIETGKRVPRADVYLYLCEALRLDARKALIRK